LEMVQSLMENFSIEPSHLAQYSTFDPITMTVDAEFGDSDGQFERVELELGINRDWEADMEGDDGRMVNIVGHKEALEKTLRDRIDDIDDADHSGPSHCTDFSQSTGNSINNTNATTRMHTHRERALTTIALVNKNSTLTNKLEDAEEQLNTMIAQNLALQGQLAGVSNIAYDTSSNISQEQDGNTRMDVEGPDMIRGRGVQGWGLRIQSTGSDRAVPHPRQLSSELFNISPSELFNISLNQDTAPQADLPSPNSTTQQQTHNKMWRAQAKEEVRSLACNVTTVSLHGPVW
jgi:hypothetical protein